MGQEQIQQILDDLDLQLAAGKIDLPTYQALVQKWSARLPGGVPVSPTGAAGAATPAPRAVVAVKVACPNCGAPLDQDLSLENRNYTCEYCSHTFTLQRAQEETEKLKKELQGWLSQMVTSGGGGATVDATSRAFIFREKLYPSIDLEFSRSLEWFDGFREFPLFQVQSASAFPTHSGEASPLRAERQHLGSIRNLCGKLNAPAVREFVVTGDDERKLALMQLRVTELIHVANILDQSAQFTADGYRAAQQNIEALQNLYARAKESAGTNAERLFLQACLTRLQAAAQATDILASMRESALGELSGSSFAQSLESPLHGYSEALRQVDESGYSPMETVPWRQGVEKEIALLRLEATLLECYDRAVAGGGGQFLAFQSAVAEFARNSKAPVADPQSLAILAEGVTTILEAKRGQRPLPRLADWSWVPSAVEANRKKSVVKWIGVDEQVERVDEYWQPFWLGTLTFSQAEGAIFKSGATKQLLVLLDATSPNSTYASTIEQTAPLHAELERAPHRESVDQRATLPALVGEAAAQKALDNYVRSNPSFRNAKVVLQKVIFLPVTEAVYNSKEGRRSQAFCPVSGFNAVTAALRQGTAQFVQRFAR